MLPFYILFKNNYSTILWQAEFKENNCLTIIPDYRIKCFTAQEKIPKKEPPEDKCNVTSPC